MPQPLTREDFLKGELRVADALAARADHLCTHLKIPQFTQEQFSVIHRMFMDGRVSAMRYVLENPGDWDFRCILGITQADVDDFVLRAGGVDAEDIKQACDVKRGQN